MAIDSRVFQGQTHCGKPTSAHIILKCDDKRCATCYPCALCMGLGAWRETWPFKGMSEPYMEPAPCPRCGKRGRRPETTGWGSVP